MRRAWSCGDGARPVSRVRPFGHDVVPVGPGPTWARAGARPEGASTFPGRGGPIGGRPRSCQTIPAARNPGPMVTREEILILGLTAGVVGSLVGGLMLGVGLGLAVQGAHIG